MPGRTHGLVLNRAGYAHMLTRFQETAKASVMPCQRSPRGLVFAITAALLVLFFAATAWPQSNHVLRPGFDSALSQAFKQAAQDAGCSWTKAAVQRDHVDASFVCESKTVDIVLRHPAQAGPESRALTNTFCLSFSPNTPTALVQSLQASLGDAAFAEAWERPTLAPRPAESTGQSVRRRVFLGVMGADAWGERVLLAALGLAVVRAVWRERWSRRNVLAAFALAVLSAAARCLVPRVPANFYSDLGSPYPSFRFDQEYVHPVYSSLWWLTARPDAPMLANIVLGACVPPLVLVVLQRTRRPAGSIDPDPPERLALPMALAVAVLPLYVRMSATDAAAVAALFFLAVGAWLFSRAMDSLDALDVAGSAIAAYLIGATRIELALAPLLWVLLSLRTHGAQRLRKRLTLIVPTAVAIAAGVLWTRQTVVGAPNAAFGLHIGDVRAYLIGFPRVLLLPGRMVPWLLRLGVLAALVLQTRARRAWVLAAYVGGVAVFTLPSVLVPGMTATVSDPLSSWAMARYALLWQLLPTYVAVWGLTLVLSRRWLVRFAIDRVVVGVALCLNAGPSYTALARYQTEYLYLEGFFAREKDAAVLAGWQKYAGVDLQDSLALPYYALADASRPRRWVVLEADRIDEAGQARTEHLYYFQNTLTQLEPSSPDIDPLLANTLERFRALQADVAGSGTTVLSEPIEAGPSAIPGLRVGEHASLAMVRMDGPWHGAPGAEGRK